MNGWGWKMCQKSGEEVVDPSEAAAAEECCVCLIKLSHIKNERDDDLWRNLICGTVIDSKTYKMGYELFQSSLFVFYFFFFA